MNVIKSFTLRSLKRNKKWTIVTVIGIIIATAMITAVWTLTGSFVSYMRQESISDTGNWHAVIQDAPYAKVQNIEADELVKTALLSRDLGYAVLPDSKNPNKPYLFLKQYDDQALQNFPVHLVSGRLPQNDSEIVISEHIESNGGVAYALGDRLQLSVGQRMTADGSEELGQNNAYEAGEEGQPETQEKLVISYTKEYTVVGIMARPGNESRTAPGYTVVTYLDRTALAAGDTVDVSIVANKLNKSIFTDFEQLAKQQGLEGSLDFNNELLRYYGLLNDDTVLQIIYIFALVMVVIIMVAAVSLIYNAFAISVSERIKQLGMLASVGATKRQKKQNVYFEGFLVGIVGIPLGILAGIGGIAITLEAVRPLLDMMMNTNTSLELVVSPLSVILTAAFAAVTIFISVYVPARRASKIMPIDAIRQSKEIKLTAKKVRTNGLTRKLFGFEGELALKNLKRSRKKYRATIISLTISLVLFLTVATVVDYTKSAADIRLSVNQVNFDVWLTLNDTTKETEEQVFRDISQLELVEDWSIAKELYGTTIASADQLPARATKSMLTEVNGGYQYGVYILCLDDAAFAKYIKSIGANTENFSDEASYPMILVNKSIGYSSANKNHFECEAIQMEKGDTLQFKLDEGEGEADAETSLTIAGVTEELPLGGAVQYFGNIMLVTSEDVFERLAAEQKQTENQRCLALKTSDGIAIDQSIQDILNQYKVTSTSMVNVEMDAKQEKSVMTLMGVFIYGFITLISLICIANIFNTVSTNIALRRKEFAMLRSVGMTPKSFNRMMNYESIFYGMKALLYGLPISAALGYLLYRVLDSEVTFAFHLPWMEYGIAIALVFVIVAATMLYSSSKIKKENIIDALKDETM